MTPTARAYLEAANLGLFFALLVSAVVLALSLDPLLAAWLGLSAGLVVATVDLAAGEREVRA